MNFSSKNTWIVILFFSLFEFIIKKNHTWNQHLNEISQRCIDWFGSIISPFMDFCSDVIIEITTAELR